ncbi:MAG: cation:proton antiporter, partial [Salinibacter sp.]
MTTALPGLLMLVGTGFMLIAAIGLLRLPDLYTRMHAVTKAGTLG